MEGQEQQRDYSEEIPPEEWDDLVRGYDRKKEMKKIDIETFKKQFMEHPKKDQFINWYHDFFDYEDANTMLHCAIECKRWDIVKLLLDHGADATIGNKEGSTASLTYAVKEGHIETVKLMVTTIVNDSGNHVEWAMLFLNVNDALKKIDIETFKKQFMEHPKKEQFINWKNDDIAYGITMLHCAIKYERYDIAKELLDHGADVNIANTWKETALMEASEKGHNETVKRLVEMGADIKAVCTLDYGGGKTALTKASRYGHDETVKILFEMGTWDEIPPFEWKEMIKRTYNHFHDKGVKILITQFLEHPKIELFINWKGDDYYEENHVTMLHCAIMYRRIDIVKLLIDHGADITVADKDGKAALTIAFEERDRSKALEPLFAKLSTDPSVCNSNGQTVLREACLQNKKEIAKKVLDLGTDKDKIDDKGHTALFYAAEKGYTNIVQLLMSQNADGNKTDERRVHTGYEDFSEDGYEKTLAYTYCRVADGRTPLFVAAQNGHQNVVAVLLQHGADPYLCNHLSKIPRDVSVAYGPIQQLFRIHDFFDKREKGGAYEEEYKTCVEDYDDSTGYKGKVAPLQNIIHDIVKYPHFADKFFELYQENREIVNWLDRDGRTVRQVACKECHEVTLFMGRYDMEVQPMYESPTCKIYKGLDYGGREEQLKQPRPVVMKMMENEEHYLNEIRARQKDDGSPRFSSEFVTPYLAVYRTDEHPEFAKAREMWNANESEKNNLYGFLIPMELGGRNLMESMNAENLSAGHKDLQRRDILLNLIKIFVYIHGVGYIHGDIKPHNVVRHTGDGATAWKAIDFDACTKIGDIVGLKLTTGSAPPEMMKIVNEGDISVDTESKGKTKIILRQPGGDLDEDDLVLADPSFDVWSFGILMYQLVTGRSFFHSDLQGNVNEAGLQELANLTQDRIDMKLESVTDANARVVLKDILLLDPKERPTMSKIEEYPYFHPSKESDPQGPSALEYTSTGQVVPKSVTKLTIGKDLEQIAKGVCSGNGQLEVVDTSKAHSLEVVGEKAFSSCRALETFQCPSSVKAIGLEAFHECVKLQDFTFSTAQALESIGDRAFYDCRALTMFKCPLHVKVIGKHAFHGCESLRDVDLSEAHALEMIEGRAFSFCSAVQKVAIPKNVIVVGEGFLDECGALESLVIAGENPILHLNVLLRLPEPKRELVSMDSIVEMYSNNPVKNSELSGESSKVASLLQQVKQGYIESIKTSDDPIRKISKRDGWVEFLSAHANDSKEDCIKMLITFLENAASIGVVRILADSTDRLGRVSKMIAPQHIRKVFEKRLFFLGRYDIAKGAPIHKSATCIVMKAMDAQMSDYYKEMFEELVQGNNTVDKEKFTEIMKKMKLISYDETNIKELFHKVDVDQSGTVSKTEFVDFCMAELGHDVVLKFMRNKDQYRRELNGRDGLDPRFVVGCIHNHDTSTNPDLLKSLQDTMQSQEEEESAETLEKTDGASRNEYCYVIVMPFGDRNLASHHLSK